MTLHKKNYFKLVFFVFFIACLSICCIFSNLSHTSLPSNSSNTKIRKLTTDKHKTFTLDSQQAAQWNITDGTLQFEILQQPTNEFSHGQVKIIDIIEETKREDFAANNLTIRDCVYYNQTCYDVVSICDYLFADLPNIAGNIYLGNKLQSIGICSFANLSAANLQKIIMPPSLKDVGDLAFNNDNVEIVYFCSTECVNLGTFVFGTNMISMYVNANLVQKYNNLPNNYVIFSFKDATIDDLTFDRNALKNQCINVSSNAYILLDTITIGTDNKINPSINVQITNLSDFNIKWLYASQSNDYQHIDLYVNRGMVPLFPTSFVLKFDMCLNSASNIYISKCITIITSSYVYNNLPHENYLMPMCEGTYINDNQKIHVNKKTTTLHFDVLSCCLFNLEWPSQNVTFIVMPSKELMTYSYFDKNKDWLLLSNNPNGTFECQIIASSPNIQMYRINFVLVINNKSNLIFLYIFGPLTAVAIIIVLIVVIHKKHKKNHKHK